MDVKDKFSWELASQPPSIVSMSTTTSLTIAVISVLGLRILYNLYFQPRYKSPAYIVASEVTLAFLQLRGTSHHELKKSHEKYCDVVRISLNTLSFIGPSAWTDIYKDRKSRASLPGDPLFCIEMLLDSKTITLASDVNVVPIRRAMNPTFSHKTFLEQEPMLQDRSNHLVAQIGRTSREHGSVDMRKWFTCSTFDITSAYAFGKDLGCVERGKYHEWVQFVTDYFYAADIQHQCHKFWPLNRLLAFLISPSVKEK